MALLDDVKLSLRISNTAYDSEITDLINAAKADLGLSGVLDEHILDTDTIIKRAIITYCKANFGFNNPDAERLQNSYNMLKAHMSLSADYSYYAITFDVTDSGTSEAIRKAEVTFNGVSKTTDASGQAVFYMRSGNNLKYAIAADGYNSDNDEDNLLDVTASQTVAISLTAV